MSYNILQTKRERLPVEKHHQSAYAPAVRPDEGFKHKILVISGLPGSGKTTLASMVAHACGAVHFNADQIRNTVNKHLKFDKVSRMTQADSLGNMCRWVADAGHRVVVDFVCPDFDTRENFLHATLEHQSYVSWVEVTRPSIVSRFEDTLKMYQPMHDSPFLDLMKVHFLHLVNDDTDEHALAVKIINHFLEP